MASIGDANSTGHPIPLGRHSIIASLPTWSSNIRYRSSEIPALELMQTGYPRFWMPKSIRTLTLHAQTLHAVPSERALLLTSALAAKACTSFLIARGASPSCLRSLTPVFASLKALAEVHALFFPIEYWRVAKVFWMHTGLGISSRLAAHYLELLGIVDVEGAETDESFDGLDGGKQKLGDGNAIIPQSLEAKLGMRKQIAALVSVDIGDVFLYPAGMAAIWSAHQLLMRAYGDSKKSVCFGFPYVDTLKVLEKWGPGCHFFPDGNDIFLDDLEKLLISLSSSTNTSPILALFTEIPSNPLLVSVNLPRLRQLADKFGFPIVVDDTIGNFVNVDALKYVDIVVTSLTKSFSGRANVLGGSLILNPKGSYYAHLHAHLTQSFTDTYFPLDALVMAQNSADFVRRTSILDSNAEWVCDKLREVMKKDGGVIADVYYPKYKTRANYDAVRRPKGGYGPLITVLFSSILAASAFHDALPFSKGPSFGTNFTLASPYTIVAYYGELGWAGKYGALEEMVRISVGMEEKDEIWRGFSRAIEEAEKANREAIDSEGGGKGTMGVDLAVSGKEIRVDTVNDPNHILYSSGKRHSGVTGYICATDAINLA